MQSHRNVLHHIRNYTNNLHIKADDRLTLLSSYSFDAAVMDIFGALLNGAALYPMDIRKEEDSSTLFDRMIEERISIYHSTPTVYRYLVGTLTRKKDLSTIRFVVLGGEEVQKKDVDLFKQYFSAESIFVNGLGPTESTVTLQYFLNHETQTPANIVPVGYPVEETEVLLLDKAGRRAEVCGEIGIRSAHVALGYWQRPEMTGAAFVADPEGGAKRIYRTGDMGRLLPDGSIGFMGRKDFQVKIRGFRIELGEVEAVLSQHPGVRESIVLVREDQPGEKRLVGYVVLHQKPGLTIDELRSFLKQKLPDYMVPSAFVMLEALPLTPNGKVDRRSLPAPDQTRPELWEAFVAPRTELERTIAKIWGEELNLREVGIHDNFFDLGGHSLLIVKVAGKLGAALNKEIRIVQMFKYPTIQLLAAHLSQLQDKRPSFTESQQRAAARREALERRRRVV
jgi:acyl-coenzyme A synthetase/AMP-(fatty) acid ligase